MFSHHLAACPIENRAQCEKVTRDGNNIMKKTINNEFELQRLRTINPSNKDYVHLRNLSKGLLSQEGLLKLYP